MKNTPKEPITKVRIKKSGKQDGEDSSADFLMETMFLLIEGGRLYIQTTNLKETSKVSFGRSWKPVTGEDKNVVSLCGLKRPSDGLYKVVENKVVKLLPT
jgi:hypothetical protein